MAYKRKFNGKTMGFEAHTPSMREREVPSADFLARAHKLFPDQAHTLSARNNRTQFTV